MQRPGASSHTAATHETAQQFLKMLNGVSIKLLGIYIPKRNKDMSIETRTQILTGVLLERPKGRSNPNIH